MDEQRRRDVEAGISTITPSSRIDNYNSTTTRDDDEEGANNDATTNNATTKFEPLAVIDGENGPQQVDETNNNNNNSTANIKYMTGWKLYVLIFALCLSQFLSALETTIVSTSLVSISNALGGFEERDWVVTSYLITYTGFLIIYAKFSDILGRKLMILIALGVFIVFSIVCGSVGGMTELIIFRSLQGLGASGIYSMVTVVQPELVPPAKWGNVIAVTSLTLVLSSVLGPILGGVINSNGNGNDEGGGEEEGKEVGGGSWDGKWRWVFLLNAPAGLIAWGLVAFVMDGGFPVLVDNNNDEGERGRRREGGGGAGWKKMFEAKLSRDSLGRLDGIGAGLLIAATVLIVFAFEEAGSRYGWGSPAIVSTLVIGAVLFWGFVAWEGKVEGQLGRGNGGGEEKKKKKKEKRVEPIFPLRLMGNRLFAGLILVGFFTGMPFMTVLINLPQRFQAVDGESPFQAGIRMLPMLLASPVATIVAGQLTAKFKVPPFYLLVAASSLQLLGIGLSTSVDFESGNQMYGYQVIMGFGFGMGLVTLLIFTPLVVDKAHLAVGMASVTQVRTLGGAIGLAISATVLNNHLASSLADILSAKDLARISESVQNVNSLPDSTRHLVRRAFADGFNRQFRVMMYFSAVVWICSITLWERKLRSATKLMAS